MTTQTDRKNGVIGNPGFKTPCRVATSANITLEGLQTIDGVVLVANDRVLVTAQTDATENGIYVAAAAVWVRAKDWDGPYDIVSGTLTYVTNGTSNNGFYYVTTANPIVVATDSVAIAKASTVLTVFNAFAQTYLDDTTALAVLTTLGIWAKGADIASAATTDLGAIDGYYHDITGSTTITGLGTIGAGVRKVLQFDTILTLTYNATSLILPGNVNIITAAGDQCEAMSLGSGNWVVLWYTRDAAGHAAILDTSALTANRTISIPDAATTMVGTNTTQTLTNKTLTAPIIAAISSAADETPPVFNDAAASREIIQGCWAWVNFNGTGTVAIRDSFNVSSITDGGTGRYTINFATALPNANYVAMAQNSYSSDASAYLRTSGIRNDLYIAASVNIETGHSSSTTHGIEDSPLANVVVFCNP